MFVVFLMLLVVVSAASARQAPCADFGQHNCGLAPHHGVLKGSFRQDHTLKIHAVNARVS
jgi:hypothetical protein